MGSKLKKAKDRELAPPPPKNDGGRGGLLDAIKNRSQIQLKKVDREEVAPKEEEKKDFGVMGILARRAALAVESSSEESGWDDE